MSPSIHPPASALVHEPLPADVAAHLERCPRCRIDRRMLGTEPTEAPELGIAAQLDALERSEPGLLTTTWRHTRATGAGAARAPLLPEGTTLGDVTLDGAIGAGGMSQVYRGTRPDGTVVAVKVPLSSAPMALARLGREGAVLQAFRHPNVVPVLEVLDADGPALVLEYVPGPPLSAVLGLLPLPEEAQLSLVRDVVAGVAAAHAAGLVHRDLKPSNVLLDPRADGVRARVADFGLAKLLAPDDADGLRTRTGDFLGTPMYQAPEQLVDASRVDARTDVFALGTLVYELVTGRPCFAGASLPEIVRRISDLDFVPPEELVQVPAPLAALLRRALRADPADRPADARALLADLPEGNGGLDASTGQLVASLARVDALPSPLEGLAPWERAVIERLARSGPLTAAAVEAAVALSAWPEAPWVLDVVEGLLDRGLLVTTGSEPTFALAPFLQARLGPN